MWGGDDLPCILGVIFLATQLRRVPLPVGLIIAIGGLTYPLYLLHMQLGYAILTAFAPAENIWAVAIIVVEIMLLSWIVWRFIERPT
jgi:peptidoglycan/LPS O-acetylase OafA/YrhL